MKRFLKVLCNFVVVVIMLSTGADYFISSGLRTTDVRKYAVWNDIFSKPINADVLVVGSSRAWCAYNTYIIDSLLGCNSYNLGIDGHTLEYQILRYNTYRRFNKKPKTVILNVDFYSTLGETSDAQYEREQFFPYILDDSLISVVSERKHLTVLDRYVPLYRYIGYRDEFELGVKSFMGGGANLPDGGMYKGYRGNNWEWEEPNEINTSKHLLKYIEPTLLNDFVCNLVNDGINVILCKSPFYDWMYQHYSGIEISDNQFADIAQKYNCLLLDYYHCNLSHDKNYFYNPSHLNAHGSDLFTKMLCCDINKSVIKEKK